MEQQLPIDAAPPDGESGLAAKIEGQKLLVEKLELEYEAEPSPALRLELRRKTDVLLHLRNLAKPDPKTRAMKVAETARLRVLREAFA